MNKKTRIALFALACSLTVEASQAQTLMVNGEVVQGVQVKGVGFEPGEIWNLKVDTVGGETLVVEGDETEPGPDPEPEPIPDPVTGNVIQRYHIQNWGNSIAGVTYPIPQGATVASRFTTTDELGLQGGIYFQSLGDVKPRTDVWISQEPGGAVLNDSTYCQANAANFTYRVLWKQEQGFPWYCTLQTETTYYINVKHTDPMQPANTVTRKVY